MAISCLGVIPARLKSTRLPEKPLKDIRGKSLLQRVWEQARQAKNLARVVIATDDPTIESAAKGWGAEVIMTSDKNPTGSDRVAEVASKIGSGYSLVANVQGDMPFINPQVIDQAVATLAGSSEQFGMCTIVTPIFDREEFERPSCVKAVLGAQGQVLYFSRAPIPYPRAPEEVTVTPQTPWGFRHMGLYVFRPDTLARLGNMDFALTEQRERLEQLRLLANGVQIKVSVIDPALLVNQIEVDTPEDLAKACEIADKVSAHQGT
jgi:3-deoxy-manno-octulosonate cytidylyltransferase (CMP-KDO synthetase)